MLSMGKFASSAYRVQASLDALNLEVGQREKAEASLRLSNSKLENLIEKRTDSLRRLTIRLLRSQDEDGGDSGAIFTTVSVSILRS
jgi:hypothetical protein